MGFKHFCEQAFFHDSWDCGWNRIDLTAGVGLPRNYFYDGFIKIIKKTCPCLYI